MNHELQESSEVFMMGGGGVSPFPISASLATTFFSAVTVLGVPAEVYIFGIMYFFFAISLFLSSVLAAEIFGPLYRATGVSSTYEYLGLRFNSAIRYLALAIFYIQNIAYIGIVIYTPSLALETVTGTALENLH